MGAVFSNTSWMGTSGAVDGSPRPRMPRISPARSTARPRSPSRCVNAARMRLPRLCPAISFSPPKRKSKREASARSAPESARSELRMSPGAETRYARRRRPELPPSSAVVTIAVIRSRSAAGRQVAAVVGAAGHVLHHQPRRRLGPEEPVAPYAGRGQVFVDERPELLLEPGGHRDVEPALALAEGFVGQEATHRPLQHVLQRQAGHLEYAGKAEHELHDPVVEQGHADLEGMGHAHAVDLHEDVVGQVDPRVGVEKSIERVVVRDLVVMAAVDREGGETAIGTGAAVA